MNRKTPEIRFEGYTDAWEERKLGGVSERVRGNDGRMDLPTLTISASSGWLDQRERFSGNIAGKEQKNYTLLSKGELSYNHGNSKIAKYGVVFELRTYEKALVPRVYHSFKTTKEASPDFIEYMFATKIPDRELAKLISSGARMDGLLNINYDEFMGIKISIPKPEEQMKIAEFLRGIDTVITLQERKLKLLKEQKKAYLQKMFPKQGEKIPELRFQGFTDAWEERKLGELGKTQSGIGFPDAEQGGTKGVPFYKVSDMNNIGNENIMSNANNYVSEEQIFRKKWKPIKSIPAVIFAKVGAAIMLNRKRIVTTPFLIDNNTMAYIFDENWDINFGKTLFETIQLPRYAQVGALPSYNGSDIESIDVTVPEIIEQIKIGHFFKQLDDTITLQEQQLETLRKRKKAFLQKMFV